MCLSRQNTSFVATKVCLSRQKLSRQTRVCRYTSFILTSILLLRKTRVCRDKSMLVATRLCLSRQIFVVTNVLSPQAFFSRQNVCCVFVATKMILVAAPANDRNRGRGTFNPKCTCNKTRCVVTCN